MFFDRNKIEGKKGSWRLMFEFIWKYKFTILCGFFFLAISHVLGTEHLNQRVIQYASALSFILLLHVLAKTKYTLPLTLLFSILVSVDAFFALQFKSRMTLGVLASILETNTSEIQSMSSAFFPLASLVLGLIIGIIFLSQAELRKSKWSRKVTLGLFCMLWLVFIPILLIGRIAGDDRAMQDYKISKLGTINEHTGGRTPLIVHNLTMLGLYIEEVGKLKDYSNSERTLPEGVTHELTDSIPTKIFIVIGESVYRKHMSLYGYSKKTTPFLDSLVNKQYPQLGYYNGIAAATLTRNVIRIALSFSTPLDIRPFFEEKNLMEMANQAGYETIWISNQDRIGLHDTYVGLVSSTATAEYYSNDVGSREDLDLVKVAQRIYSENTKQLFVIHLNGSHMSYYDRIDNVDREAIGGEGIVADYDASIHHTDRVLREINKLQLKNNEESVLLYVPDHGEVIGLGHGFINLSQEQLDIPFITINNSSLKVDDIVHQYMDKESETINNSNLIFVVSELMGYSFANRMKQKAIEDGKYFYHSDTKYYDFKDVPSQYIE